MHAGTAVTKDPELRAAIEAVDAGDVAGLERRLRATPELLQRRVEIDDEPPYAGYFARPQLLHHVAGNPLREPMPSNAAALARTLLEHGAEVDAGCGGGPDQPGSGGTTLGLVSSSGQAAETGQSRALLDALIGAGADVDHGNGGILYGALYHSVECPLQRDVARMVRAHGARVDLGYAAGLGEVATVQAFFDAHGRTVTGAYRLHRADPLPNPTEQEILDDALILACMNGRAETAGLLLERGASVDGSVKLAGTEVTALHAVGWAGWPDLIPLLIAHGADVNRVDPEYNGSAPGWAAYCEHPETVEKFLEYSERFDLLNTFEFGLADRARELLAENDPDMVIGDASPGCLLRTASAMGHLALTRFLLARGANPALANQEGKTALAVAREHGHEPIAVLLAAALEDQG